MFPAAQLTAAKMRKRPAPRDGRLDGEVATAAQRPAVQDAPGASGGPASHRRVTETRLAVTGQALRTRDTREAGWLRGWGPDWPRVALPGLPPPGAARPSSQSPVKRAQDGGPPGQTGVLWGGGGQQRDLDSCQVAIFITLSISLSSSRNVTHGYSLVWDALLLHHTLTHSLVGGKASPRAPRPLPRPTRKAAPLTVQNR